MSNGPGGFGSPPGGPPQGYGQPPGGQHWGGGPYGQGGPPMPMGPQPDPLAIIALVTGILSFVTCCCSSMFGLPVNVIFAIPALITGIISAKRIRTEANRFTGRGMAISGIVMGSLNILLMILLLILVIVLVGIDASGGDVEGTLEDLIEELERLPR